MVKTTTTTTTTAQTTTAAAAAAEPPPRAALPNSHNNCNITEIKQEPQVAIAGVPVPKFMFIGPQATISERDSALNVGAGFLS